MTFRLAFVAPLALSLAAAGPAFAQDDALNVEAGEGKTWSTSEDGTSTHIATGAVCPAAFGEIKLRQVLSFDKEDEHLGLTCEYRAANGASASMMIMRADAEALIGGGDDAEQWNASIYRILNNYPSAGPAQVDGLGGDKKIGLRGAVFDVDALGRTNAQIGLWFTESANGVWAMRSNATFAGDETGHAEAKAARQAVIDAKAAVDKKG